MKITIIHGQSHKGSTYHIAHILADKIQGEITEFFLPKDFHDYCLGCTTCFMKDEKLCPHYQKLQPITQAIDECDVLILASPVYVYHCTGAMKVLLDHYGYRWMVHRPQEKMFNKQAVCISTAAGAGMKSTNKDMLDSCFWWGIAKTYQLGYRVMTTSFQNINDKTLAKIEKDTSRLALQIQKKAGHIQPGLKTKIIFKGLSLMQKKGMNPADSQYWHNQNWTTGTKPWK